MIKDRSKYYKEPMKILGQKIYQSEFLNEIDNEHWKVFGDAATTDARLKVGDFIDLAVNLTAQQMVKFLDEIKKFKTIEEVYKFIDEKTIEIAKDIKL